jgi:hypothetical protein
MNLRAYYLLHQLLGSPPCIVMSVYLTEEQALSCLE